MTDEKPKPFAVVEEGEGLQRLVIGGIEVDSEADYEDAWTVAQSNVRRFRAAKITEAVEQREAKLRGALQALRDTANDYVMAITEQTDRIRRNQVYPTLNVVPLLNVVLDADMALAGTGPDYVNGDVACGLALDLGIAMDTVKDLALIVETLTNTSAANVAPFLRAMGLGEQQPLDGHETSALIEEIRRRGYYVVNPRKEPKPSERDITQDRVHAAAYALAALRPPPVTMAMTVEWQDAAGVWHRQDLDEFNRTTAREPEWRQVRVVPLAPPVRLATPSPPERGPGSS